MPEVPPAEEEEVSPNCDLAGHHDVREPCLAFVGVTLVEDVHEFPGHIACDSRTNSEIVVPVFDEAGALKAVLDIDSEAHAAFDKVDRHGLEAICALVFGK